MYKSNIRRTQTLPSIGTYTSGQHTHIDPQTIDEYTEKASKLVGPLDIIGS